MRTTLIGNFSVSGKKSLRMQGKIAVSVFRVFLKKPRFRFRFKNRTSPNHHLCNSQTDDSQDERQTPRDEVEVTFATFDDITLRVERAERETPCVGQYCKPDDAGHSEVVDGDKDDCA